MASKTEFQQFPSSRVKETEARVVLSDWNREILDLTPKLEKYSRSYDHLALLAVFTHQYALSWKVLLSNDILCSNASLLALGEELLRLLKAAVDFAKDDSARFNEVWNIVEDVKRYVQMLNRIIIWQLINLSLGEVAVIKCLQEKVEHDFTFLNLIPKRIEAQLKQIDPNVVKAIGVLGRGAYADVYRAKWYSKDVAVKEIRNSDQCEWEEESIKRELEVQGKLQVQDCSHIVRLLGVFKNIDNRKKSLVLELMTTDLQRYIEASPIDILSSVDIMIKISKGMKHLHRNGVIHRDLKPSNILVSRTTNNLIVKIANFGISKSASKTIALNTLNKGSFNFMAPEMISLKEETGYYTDSVDVYSFAMTCSVILTGKRPFSLRPIRDDIQAFKKCLEEGERPVLPTNIPKRLIDLIQLCWSGNPASRPDFEWITEQLWAVREYLLTYSALQEKISYFLQVYWSKDAHPRPTFQHVCEELFIDMKEVFTDPNLASIILNHLIRLHEDGDASSLSNLKWICDQLWAGAKDLLINFNDISGQLGSLLRGGDTSSPPLLEQICTMLDHMEVTWFDPLPFPID